MVSAVDAVFLTENNFKDKSSNKLDLSQAAQWWSLQVLPMQAWVFIRGFGFLLQYKKMLHKVN